MKELLLDTLSFPLSNLNKLQGNWGSLTNLLEHRIEFYSLWEVPYLTKNNEHFFPLQIPLKIIVSFNKEKHFLLKFKHNMQSVLQEVSEGKGAHFILANMLLISTIQWYSSLMVGLRVGISVFP
jgi:hypothetical protein